MTLELCVQLLCGGDDSCDRVDDKSVLGHTTIGHVAIRSCSEKQSRQKINGCRNKTINAEISLTARISGNENQS